MKQGTVAYKSYRPLYFTIKTILLTFVIFSLKYYPIINMNKEKNGFRNNRIYPWTPLHRFNYKNFQSYVPLELWNHVLKVFLLVLLKKPC